MSRADNRERKRKTLLPPMRKKTNRLNCNSKMGPKINTFSYFSYKNKWKTYKNTCVRYQQINKYQPISKNIIKYQQISTNINKYRPISTNININSYQNKNNKYQYISININKYQPISININSSYQQM